MKKHLKFLGNLQPEAMIWLSALLVLAFVEPDYYGIALCPLKNLGFDHCPGCGLGKSVSLALDGALAASLEAHPLGLFAIIILSFRIVNLIYTAKPK